MLTLFIVLQCKVHCTSVEQVGFLSDGTSSLDPQRVSEIGTHMYQTEDIVVFSFPKALRDNY